MPPNQRPSEPRRSSTPKCSRAGASTKTAPSARRLRRRRAGLARMCRSRSAIASSSCGPAVLSTITCSRAISLSMKIARKQVQPRRVDRGFEHGVARAVEADELAAHALVHHGRLDARARRRAVDAIAPRARATNSSRRAPRRSTTIAGTVAYCGFEIAARANTRTSSVRFTTAAPRRHDVAVGRRFQKRLQDDRVVAPLDAHRRAVDRAPSLGTVVTMVSTITAITGITGPAPREAARTAASQRRSVRLRSLAVGAVGAGRQLVAASARRAGSDRASVAVLGGRRLGMELHADHRDASGARPP